MRPLLLAVALGVLAVEAGAVSSRAPVYDHVVRDTTSSDSRLRKGRIPQPHIVHERHAPQHTEGWIRTKRADPIAMLPMRIGLKQSNVDRGHELLMDM
jgi:tripeptidyl-peptidase-1